MKNLDASFPKSNLLDIYTIKSTIKSRVNHTINNNVICSLCPNSTQSPLFKNTLLYQKRKRKSCGSNFYVTTYKKNWISQQKIQQNKRDKKDKMKQFLKTQQSKNHQGSSCENLEQKKQTLSYCQKKINLKNRVYTQFPKEDQIYSPVNLFTSQLQSKLMYQNYIKKKNESVQGKQKKYNNLNNTTTNFIVKEVKSPYQLQSKPKLLIQKIYPETKLKSNINLKQKQIGQLEQIITKSKQIKSRFFNGNNKQFIKQYAIKSYINKKDHFVFGLDQKMNNANKLQFYRDFLWKINYSNNLYIQPPIKMITSYRIFIGPGNNSLLIKSIFKKRFWWIFDDKITEKTNFVWTQLREQSYIKSQTQSNTKSILNKVYLQQLQNSISAEIEISQAYYKIFSVFEINQWKRYILENKNIEEELNEKKYLKRNVLLKRKMAKKLNNIQEIKIHNHFLYNYYLGNKKAILYLLRQFYNLNNKNFFDVAPVTFHITEGIKDPEYKKFLTVYREIQQRNNSKNIWIIKPGQFTNRGQGITVCDRLDEINERLKKKQKNANGKLRTFIIQKYLERPLLYHRRKFDIRHYMMITCINGYFKGYWYDEGYIRTTSFLYTINNCKDNFIHLTNDAIQKNNQDYGRFQLGNKISYIKFQKYLNSMGKKINFRDEILTKMEEIASYSIKATYLLLDPQKKMHNFQIFGLDFMIDQMFKPWLIEINTNPCLQLSCPLLAKIIPTMIENAIKQIITIDPLFQPPIFWPNNRKYQLGENPLESNRFKLIFDEYTEGKQIQKLYQGVDRINQKINDLSQDQQAEYEQNQQKQYDCI